MRKISPIRWEDILFSGGIATIQGPIPFVLVTCLTCGGPAGKLPEGSGFCKICNNCRKEMNK